MSKNLFFHEVLARSMLRSTKSYDRSRRGVATIEGAIALAFMLLLLFSSLELALAVLRYNLLSEAARHAARSAIVHGSKHPDPSERWGPSTVAGTAADDTPVAQVIRDVLCTIDPSDVQLTVDWPDGGNGTGERVHATVSYVHQRVVPLPYLPSQIQLQASSTMRIEH